MKAIVYYKNGYVVIPISDQEDLVQLLRSLRTINSEHKKIKLIIKNET